MKLAIFASGNGSNFQAIVDAVNQKRLDASVALLVCDQPHAYVTERAHIENIPFHSFQAKNYASKTIFEQEIVTMLKHYQIDFIVLAGYMRLIGPTLLSAYEGKIVNIHPSLLPQFPGKDAIGQALQAEASVTGVTVHYVDAGMDTGPIISQQRVEIEADETADSLSKKIHATEHAFYPSVLQQMINNKRNHAEVFQR